MNDKELLFEVGGVKIFKNAIYICKHKEDLSAPTGFQERGTTKLPSSGVDEIFQCGYRALSETEGVWDTGFHKYSPCYELMDEEVIKEKLELLKENVIVPYEKSRGKQGLLDHTNDSFWEKKMFKLSPDKVFNTKKPEDMLTLYFGLLNRELTPKGQEGDTRYSGSSFVLVDKTKDIKKKDERSSLLFKAIGLFEQLLSTDKPRLVAILSYLGMNVSKDITDDAFRSMIREHFDQITSKNVDMFLMTSEESQTDSGRDKIEIFVKLKEALLRGNKVTKNPNGILYYNDTEIGPDLKAASHNISKTKELKSIKKELLFEEELTNDDN